MWLLDRPSCGYWTDHHVVAGQAIMWLKDKPCGCSTDHHVVAGQTNVCLLDKPACGCWTEGHVIAGQINYQWGHYCLIDEEIIV